MKPLVRSIIEKCRQAVKGYFKDRSLKTFLLFLLMATVLWYGHSLNSMRDREVKLPIVYNGMPENVAFVEPLPDHVTVSLRDQGKRLRRYSKTSFSPIQLDLQAQLQGESGRVQLPSEVIRQKVSDQLQGTTRLQQILPENISVEYYKQHEKQVPVQFVGDIQLMEPYQLVGKLVLSPSMVSIFGSKESLNKIHAVSTEQLLLTDVKDSVVALVRLQPIDGVRFSTNQIEVRAAVEMFTEKIFTLPIQVVDAPANERVRLFPSQVEARVRVSVAHFGEVTEKDLQAVCVYPQGEATKLPVQLVFSSPYVTQGRLTPMEVEYIIEK